MKPATRVCARCETLMHPQHGDRCPACHHGRGLCRRCYMLLNHAGGLDAYPPTRPRRQRRDCPHGGRHTHGSIAAYTRDRCGCPACRAAKATQNHDWGKRVYLTRGPQTVDAAGTRRRIEALTALGWPMGTQSVMLGRSRYYLSVLRRRVARVNVRTAVAVASLYDRLSMTPAPASSAASHARGYARRMGWSPPLMWDDGAIDDPAAAPNGGEENHGSLARRRARIEDYRWLRAGGVGDEEMPARLGMTQAAFERWYYRARPDLEQERAA